MKRFIAILIVVFTLVLANPIDTSPTIYELQIIEPDDWYIEINMDRTWHVDIDSIFVESLDGKVKVANFDTTRYDGFYVIVITQEDMSEELLISRDSDFVRLYFDNFYFSDFYKEVCFGNFPGSGIHNLTSDQSIVYQMNTGQYCKCDSPTIGEFEHGNCTGTIYGHFYDKDGSPIKNQYAKIRDGMILSVSSDYIDSSGFYTSILPAMYHYYDQLTLWTPEITNYWSFNPVMFDLEPGDSMEVDFYASQTGIKPVIKNYLVKVSNYPHPASSYTWFNIDNTDVEASAMRMNVYDLNGRKVDSFIPSARHFRYDCGHLPQGSYVLSLQHGHEVLASKKLQILK